MNDEFKKRLRRIGAERTARFDQELQVVRCHYQALASEERKDFHAWLEGLSMLASPRPSWLPVTVLICTDDSVQDDDGQILFEATARLNPRVMLKAVQAW